MEFYLGYTTGLDENGLYPQGFVNYCNTNGYTIKDNGDKTYTIELSEQPPELTLHERALQVQLTKREFVIIIEYLTSTQVGMTPITYELISSYVSQSNWVTKREWELATYIERSHAMLDIVSNDFGISTEMLDYMFAEYQTLLQEAYAWESQKGSI